MTRGYDDAATATTTSCSTPPRAADDLGLGSAHLPGAVETADLVPRLEALFAQVDVAARPTFASRGRLCTNRRDTAWFGRRDKATAMMPLYRTYATAYGHPRTTAGVREAPPVAEMPEWLEAALGRVRAAVGGAADVGAMNHVVVTRYVEEADAISYHHDKWMDMAPGSPIVSLSVGGARAFGVKRGAAPPRRVELRDGDVVVLSYALNRTAKHKVYPRRGGAVRYSIVARHIDTLATDDRTALRHRGSAVEVAVRPRPAADSNNKKRPRPEPER